MGVNRATRKVFYATHTGRLQRQEICEVCGGSRMIEAHHDDYSKPLIVRWLCHQCHMAYHASIRPIRIASCGHGRVYALTLCRSCYEKNLRERNPDFAERQRENCRDWHRSN